MVFKMHAKNPRFLVFFAMHSLTGHDWMMDDALCSHMENAAFLGKNAWFLNCMQKSPRFLVLFAIRSLTGYEWTMCDAWKPSDEKAAFLGKTSTFGNGMLKTT